MTTEIIIFALSFAVILIAFIIIARSRERGAYQDRLADLDRYRKQVDTRLQSGRNAGSGKAYDGRNKDMKGWARFVNQITNKSETESKKIKEAFAMAGWTFRNPLLIYGVSKTLFLFPVTILVFLQAHFIAEWNMMLKVGAVIGSALLSSYVIDWVLKWAVARRQKKIEKGFPDALDLMVICSESGLSLTAIINRVAKDVGQIHPDLGYEIGVLAIELNMLSSRTEALENFANRLKSQLCKNIVGSLLQAEEYGTPIAQTMKTLAEEFRFDRLMNAEQRAAKLPVLMAGPLVLFIFPSLFIVILGPAIINVMMTFG